MRFAELEIPVGLNYKTDLVSHNKIVKKNNFV
jgi:hypothetical protein